MLGTRKAILTVALIIIGSACNARQVGPSIVHLDGFYDDVVLRALPKVGLVINPPLKFDPDIHPDKDAADSMRVAAELQLRLAGIPFEQQKFGVSGEDRHPRFQEYPVPTLVIDKSPVSGMDDRFRVEVRLVEKARIARNPRFTVTAQTWQARKSWKVWDKGTLLSDAVKEAVDEFCNSYLAANRKP